MQSGGILPVAENLAQLGWDAFFADGFAAVKKEGCRPARITAEYQGIYRVMDGDSELLAEVSGRLRHRAKERTDYPAAGDWVSVAASDAGRVVIHAVLPRKSSFSRKAPGEESRQQIIAANVDVVFIVQGLDDNFNLARLERYLALVRENSATPVIVLNKADICPDLPDKLRLVADVSGDCAVCAVSTLTGLNMENLTAYLKEGRTVAFLGSSGVGKSSIINSLAGNSMLRVNAVRENDSRGRHTTTHRQLFILKNGGLLLDTPGMRELQLWDGGNGLEDAFEDISRLAASCRFADCGHDAEPGCAVKAAVDGGLLSARRLENYRKLRREMKHLDSKKYERALAERKAAEKELSRKVRAAKDFQTLKYKYR